MLTQYTERSFSFFVSRARALYAYREMRLYLAVGFSSLTWQTRCIRILT